jgi:hypothetical protein
MKSNPGFRGEYLNKKFLLWTFGHVINYMTKRPKNFALFMKDEIKMKSDKLYNSSF